MLNTICFIIVNLTITYILYSNYKKDIVINIPFVIALYFTAIGNTLVEDYLYNINYYLSSINVLLALLINLSISSKKMRECNEHLDRLFEEMKKEMNENG